MLDYNLKQEGYETVSALNGEEGIRLAGKERPDLIILDIMLPIMDGFEVCRTLKNDDRVAHIPIIILSAKSQMQVIFIITIRTWALRTRVLRTG